MISATIRLLTAGTARFRDDPTGVARRPNRAWPRERAVALLTATAVAATQVVTPAQAAGKGPPIVRDAEIEHLLKQVGV